MLPDPFQVSTDPLHVFFDVDLVHSYRLPLLAVRTRVAGVIRVVVRRHDGTTDRALELSARTHHISVQVDFRVFAFNEIQAVSVLMPDYERTDRGQVSFVRSDYP